MNDPLIDKPLKIRRPVQQVSGPMRPFGSRRDAATAHLWDYAGCRPLAFKGRILSYRSARYPASPRENIWISLTRSGTAYDFDDEWRVARWRPSLLGLLVELAVEDRHADSHSAAPEALR